MRGNPKKRGLAVAGVVVSLALAGGAVYALAPHGVGRDTKSHGVGRDTNGYMLTPAESVGPYKKHKEHLRDMSTRQCDGAPSDADCMQGVTEGPPIEAEGIGVKEPAMAQAQYRYQYKDNQGRSQRKTLFVEGYWGTIDDPDEALDNFFQSIKDGDQSFRGKLIGPREKFDPKGFKGALMECQNTELTRIWEVKARTRPVATMQVPICVWADYSTVAATAVVDSPQILRRAPGMTQSQVADLAAELYNTSRTEYWPGVCTWDYCNGRSSDPLEN
ncbi:hypothetical protein ACFYWY_11385 [Streptomyces sp. NPDC002870]|uniref:hypothetical protein n=1 Tax=Streptomyces sp. NPDC002870 TaxID=3364666 RepID=UPI0036BAD08C